MTPDSKYAEVMGLCQGLQAVSHWPPSASANGGCVVMAAAAAVVVVCVCACVCVCVCCHHLGQREKGDLPSNHSASHNRMQGYLRPVAVTT